MSKTRKNPKTANKKRTNRIKTDPRTGLPVITGPSFTKEDIARDFPDENDRDDRIMRKSVGL